MGAPNAPLKACGTKQFVPMNKQIVFGRVKLWDTCFAKVFEFNFATHELAHVILKRFGAESHFCRERMHAGWGAS
jgi:hypothetical protein